MNSHRRIWIFLLLVLALLPVWAASPASAGSVTPENIVPAAVQDIAQGLTLDLAQQGFEVKSGYLKVYTKQDCEQYSYPIMRSCYGNNPAAPYVMPVVPLWHDEYVDTQTLNAYGVPEEGHAISHRFDPREAIVIFGLLPPQADYFGVQTYLNTRQGVWDENSAVYKAVMNNPFLLNLFFAKLPGNDKRIQIVGSLSNAINNVVIERQSASHQAFGQFRVFIITPDRYMDDAIRDALGKSSLAEGDIFTEPIPQNMRIGLQESADDFLTVFRYAMPADEAAADAWREDLPLVVLRIRDTNLARQPQRYPLVQLEERTAVENPAETALAPDLKNLAFAVSQRWGQPCGQDDCVAAKRAMNFQNWQRPPISLVGPQCTEIGMNCLADTQDTVYQLSSRLWIDGGQVYAVAGPLATVTGNATYVGLGLNSTLKKKGFDNLSNHDLINTALAYSSTVSNTEQLYLYYFTRDCAGLEGLTDGKCISISTTEEDGLPFCLHPDDPACAYLQLSVRDYIRPSTQRGPDAAGTLPPVLLALQRPGYSPNTVRLPVVFSGD